MESCLREEGSLHRTDLGSLLICNNYVTWSSCGTKFSYLGAGEIFGGTSPYTRLPCPALIQADVLSFIASWYAVGWCLWETCPFLKKKKNGGGVKWSEGRGEVEGKRWEERGSDSFEAWFFIFLVLCSISSFYLKTSQKIFIVIYHYSIFPMFLLLKKCNLNITKYEKQYCCKFYKTFNVFIYILNF